MDFGIHARFHSGSVDMPEFVARCEQLGFESFWLPEHVVVPVNPSVGPGGVRGGSIPDSYLVMFDQLIGLTVAATASKTIRLGTGVCLIPEHHPVDLAKRISTLDVYSGGRVVLGIGAGWQPEESAALGGDFKRRWTQTAESVEVMKKLWTEEGPEHSGEYYSFPPLKFYPRPLQKPHPPLLLGGTAKRVFKRVAAWGDGWAPWGIGPEEFGAGVNQLAQECAAIGRDPATASITVMSIRPDAALVKRYESAGAQRIVFVMDTAPEKDPFGRLDQIAREVGL
jgi:probable F420-dependent oxidoreductase